MSRPYQVCTRCVMDSSAEDIAFDEAGVCRYCTEFLRKSGHILDKEPGLRARELEAFVAQVKKAGHGKPYDCVVGVSGGVDSSWVLVQAVKLGLRPLAVHMDNGWNSELAQNNIENLVRGLGVDLYTYVIDWDEYRKLMQAFFDADVIDVELLYDNAMRAVNYQQAAKHGIKFILGGTNDATEGMKTPPGWNWYKLDARNIRSIASRNGKGMRLKTFPAISTGDLYWYEFVRRIRWISFLNLLDYNKFAALDALKEGYGYKPYPYKHYESVFTRFYQGYLLPEKFKVDKRRLHLSTLVASGQMTRDQASAQLQGIPYASEEDLRQDRLYFLKKMGWSEADLVRYLGRPPRKHSEYPSERAFWMRVVGLYQSLLSEGSRKRLRRIWGRGK